MTDIPREITRKKTSYTEREIWTTGRRGSVVCINVLVYPHSIVATADAQGITERMMEKALNREFPRHTFYWSAHEMRADADRWVGDGLG